MKFNSSDNPYKWDAFISYSSKDGYWVYNHLLRELDSANIRTCIDTRDFEIGLPSVTNMINAIERSRKTIIVLSSNWVESEWACLESLMLQMHDPTGLKGRILPILLERCEIPLNFRFLTYSNFTQNKFCEVETARIISCVKAVEKQEATGRPPTQEKNNKNISFDLTFVGNAKGITEAELAWFQTMLQQISKDFSLNIVSKRDGSVILQIESTQDAYNRICRLMQTGKLDKHLDENFTSVVFGSTKTTKRIEKYDVVVCIADKINYFDAEYSAAQKLLPPVTTSIYNVSIYVTAKYIPKIDRHYYYVHSNFIGPEAQFPTKLALENVDDMPTVLYNILRANSEQSDVTWEETIDVHENGAKYILNEIIVDSNKVCEIDMKNAKNVKIVREIKRDQG